MSAPARHTLLANEGLWSTCSLAVRLVDASSGTLPLGPPRLKLEREEPSGAWAPVHRGSVPTLQGLHVFFDLERYLSAHGRRSARYRLLVATPLYLPASLAQRDDESVLLTPFDGSAAHPPPPPVYLELPLYPSAAYPFPAATSVLRGSVRSASGAPAAHVLVSCRTANQSERTLSDAQGQFALPLRRVRPATPTLIEARDRSGRSTSLTVVLPQALAVAVSLQLP